MKTARLLVIAALLLGYSTLRLNAQDPLAVAPDMYKLVFENDRVRVLEVTFQPGQKIAPHSHPEHFAYVLEAGTLRISKPEAEPSDVALTVGQVVWLPAETHWAENISQTVVRLLVTELKEPAPAKAAAAAAGATSP